VAGVVVSKREELRPAAVRVLRRQQVGDPAIKRGAVGRRAQGVLAALLEQRLRSFEPLRVPARLAAVQLAGLLLAGVGDWLEGRQEISAGDLARSLGDSSIAVRRAIQVAG